MCGCHEGYTGKQCEVDILECASNPCMNQAECIERSRPDRPGFTYTTAAGYDCKCQPGYEGNKAIHCSSLVITVPDISKCCLL